MKAVLFVLVIIFLCTLGVSAEKQVNIPESSFNFGKIVQHVTVIHDFWIKSVGDESIRIVKVNPGCGCTQIPLTDSLIAPGDSISLRIILDTQAFRGRVNKMPSFEIDSDSTTYHLKLYAEIETSPTTSHPLRLSPVEIDVSQFSEKARRRGKLQITNHSQQDFILSPIDTAGRSFSVRLPQAIPAGGKADVFVVVHKDAVLTDFKESITFEVVGETIRERYTIPVIRMYKPKK